MTTPGRIAFDAYSQAMGGRTHDGQPIPPWSQLGHLIQQGWEAAALAALGWVEPTEAGSHVAQALGYARQLSAERSAADGQAVTQAQLAADQGHALRKVIAHGAAALVAAMTEPSAIGSVLGVPVEADPHG